VSSTSKSALEGEELIDSVVLSGFVPFAVGDGATDISGRSASKTPLELMCIPLGTNEVSLQCRRV